MSLNTRNAQKAHQVTIKHKGRKYVVVHQSVTLKLIKRAGKVQWFTLEGGKEADVVRHKDFWAALEHYSGRQDALGINPHEALPAGDLTAIVAELAIFKELEVDHNEA